MLFWIVLSGVIVSINVSASGTYPDFLTTARYVGFNLVSMATTCGLVSTDYSHWPAFAPMWMLFLSCLCASTGSTGGGIKMFRSLVLSKQSIREMYTLVHPQAVAPLKDRGADGAQWRGPFGAGLHLPVLHHHRRPHFCTIDVGTRFHVLAHRDHRQH